MNENNITIIGIAGGTGSGKTTVVKKIVEALPPHYVAVVPLDSYYNDTSHMTDEERHAINFDHPDAFDWKLLIKQINALRNGEAIEQPTYSYILCNRLPETIHVFTAHRHRDHRTESHRCALPVFRHRRTAKGGRVRYLLFRTALFAVVAHAQQLKSLSHEGGAQSRVL